MKYKYETVIYLRGDNPVHDTPENTWNSQNSRRGNF